MISALLIFIGLLALVLANAASLGGSEDPTTLECQSEDELWGSPDLRKYYFCYEGKTVEVPCDDGAYFVKNETVYGCVQADLMNPACVNLNAKEPDCTGVSKKQPQACDDLSKFYLCTDDGVATLSCDEGKAFVDQDGYLGCFAWSQWRQLRNCPED
ncbi:hypothetical protein KR018_003803, partial [Drosophila ironensis]